MPAFLPFGLISGMYVIKQGGIADSNPDLNTPAKSPGNDSIRVEGSWPCQVDGRVGFWARFALTSHQVELTRHILPVHELL